MSIPRKRYFIAFCSIFEIILESNLDFRSWNEPKRKNEKTFLKNHSVGVVNNKSENGRFIVVKMDVCRTTKHQTKINRNCSLILDYCLGHIQTSADSTIRVLSLSRFCPDFPENRVRWIFCPAGQGPDRAVRTFGVLVRLVTLPSSHLISKVGRSLRMYRVLEQITSGANKTLHSIIVLSNSQRNSNIPR